MATNTIPNANRANDFPNAYVDVSSYTTSSKYTIPEDGYVWWSIPNNGMVHIYGSSSTSNYLWFTNASSQNIQGGIFVRKGMKVCKGNTSNVTIRYFQLG